MAKSKTIQVKGTDVSIYQGDVLDYISKIGVEFAAHLSKNKLQIKKLK